MVSSELLKIGFPLFSKMQVLSLEVDPIIANGILLFFKYLIIIES